MFDNRRRESTTSESYSNAGGGGCAVVVRVRAITHLSLLVSVLGGRWEREEQVNKSLCSVTGLLD